MSPTTFNILCLLINLIPTLCANQLVIQNLHKSPVLLIKQNECRIQTGTTKIIHPIDLAAIGETADTLTNTFYNKLATTNLLGEIIKFKIKKLYASLYDLKPLNHHRQKRWDTIGTACKWVAGSPDADDLRITNITMNDLIDQNNEQFKINKNINQRIQELTTSINLISVNLNRNKQIIGDWETVILMLNIDIISELLEDIQETITLSKISLTNNKILSTHEITTIKTLLQDQGVELNYPDEALQYVTTKIAVKNQQLLYILHVPQLVNTTSIVYNVYPLINDNQMIINYPTHVMKSGNTIFTTENPSDYVQKSSYIRELEDKCIRHIILGKHALCNSTFANHTIQKLINENTILLSNAIDSMFHTTCGPDNRTLNGNFLISISNCTITINNQQFQNTESITPVETYQGAFHNLLIKWNLQDIGDLRLINNVTIGNRQKLEYVYLQQHTLNLKFWTLFGSYSASTLLSFVFLALLWIRCKLNCFQPRNVTFFFIIVKFI
ncbi:uncharacterized protein LOC131690236 isoform X5 [Topomyia yanbarensis]|uniref:uncharacterized protein LOC131690236 isoform X5 n=1 Tax=Topomyia yanbarensis TaxID=2498891 RepID=UPI00273B0CFE|nr:uncharacterized protein LOC131690236 isoform X5 [Topomyia yanbarensis]